MWDKATPLIGVVLSGGLASGCTTIPRHAGFPDVANTVEARTGLYLQQYGGAPTGLVADTIRELLRDELTVDRAVRIALLNNRALQATLEELGIARADAVQASLLSNPIFSGHARVPEETGRTNLELALAQSVVETLLLPLRQRVARAQFEQTKLHVTDAILRFLAEIKTAYYTAQVAEQLVTMRQTVLQATEAAAELAQRQYDAGNIRDFDLATEQAAHEEAQADLTRAETERIATREMLTQFLGFSGPDTGAWRMAATLPDLPASDPSPEALETLAIQERFDLAASRQELEALRRGLTVARFGILPTSAAGINTETEPDGDRVTGPTWDVEVPIFDWGQATRGRLKAQLRQSQHRLAALEVAVRSDVRTAAARLAAQRQLVARYQDQLVPLRRQIVASSQKHFNYMLIGAFQLLQFKQQEIAAQQAYIEALRDYWIARAELERTVGGRLPETASLPPSSQSPHPEPQPQEMPGTDHSHHHGGIR
ncbi:MAG: TolC family protein [Candidatus Omnitrophota bacterium]|nr:TolC family protein [Candidatus Omnitrophota bacterium]